MDNVAHLAVIVGHIAMLIQDGNRLFDVIDDPSTIRSGIARQKDAARCSEPSREFFDRQRIMVETRTEDGLQRTTGAKA